MELAVTFTEDAESRFPNAPEYVMRSALATIAVAHGIPRFWTLVRRTSSMLVAAHSLREEDARASAPALNCRRLREDILNWIP